MTKYRPDLFCFDWYVDERGYEPVSAAEAPPGVEKAVLSDPPSGGGWCLRRRGGALRAYSVLDDLSGLARRFAHLPREPEAILEFASEYGFLGYGQTEHPDNPAWEEEVLWWHTHIQGMRHVVEGIDAGQRHSMAKIFNGYVEPRMTVRIEAGQGGRPALYATPTNLLGQMWLQIAREITNERKFRKCVWCPAWFPYGRGTGHKKTKLFCSDRCRKASSRAQRRGG